MSDIEKRIIFSFGLVSFTFLIMTIITLVQINKVTESSRKIQNVFQPSIAANLRLTNAINSSISGLQSWVLTKDDTFLRKRAAFQVIVEKNLKQLLNQSTNWENQSQLNELNQLPEKINKFNMQQTEIITLQKNQPGSDKLQSKNAKPQPADLLFEHHLPLSYEIIAHLRQISDPQTWAMTRTFKVEEQQEVFLKNVALLFFFLSTIGGITLAILLNRSVLMPLKTTMKLADQISKGNYESISGIKTGEKKLDDVLTTMLQQLKEKQQINNHQQKELESTNLTLKTSNEELSQFAYRTSHDLRAPLITVRGLALAALEDIEDGDLQEAKCNANRIAMQTKKLESLVAGILALKKAEQEQSSEHVNIEKLLSEIQTRLKIIYLDNKVAIVFRLPPGFTVYGSNVRIHQIMENLISNGIKYSDPQKISSHVKIQGLYKQQKKVIIVEDNGIGIPQKQVKNLFGMFQRFHPDVSHGSGLGLYIVKKHVAKLGGKISYVKVEQGTQFILEFEN